MSDAELVELVAEDLAVWLESGRPIDRRDRRLAAYQRTLGLLLTLRELLDDRRPGPSAVAMAIERTDEALGAGRVLGRLRRAVGRLLDEIEGGTADVPPGLVAMLRLARE